MKIGAIVRVVMVAAIIAASETTLAISFSPTLLPVSNDRIKLGEWNSNFAGARAVADIYNIPLVVFFGGLSCGKCETMQRACLGDDFLAWQASHRMLMVYTTNNSLGDATHFARPDGTSGFPYIAVYWNRSGEAPQKDTAYYRTFTGRDGEMLVKGGTLAEQLMASIELVVGEYDFTREVDISAREELLYSRPVTTKTAYSVSLFTGFDAARAFPPQRVYNLKGAAKPKLKKVSGALPKGLKLVCEDGMLKLSGAAKSPGSQTYVFSIEQKRNGVTYDGPDIALAFSVVAANDASRGGCAMLGKVLKATVPVFSNGSSGKAMAGVLEFSATARNAVKAKYTGTSNAKTSFSGKWAGIEGGVARADLSSGVRRLVLELGAGGAMKAALSDPSAGVLESLDGMRVCDGSAGAAFAGSCTVSLIEKYVNSGTGSGYVCIKKVTPQGKVSWAGVLGNGQSVSGNAFAMIDSSGCGNVAVFKVKGKDYIAASLKVRPSSQAPAGARAVVESDGTVARWGHTAAPVSVHECYVRGSRYAKGKILNDCCAGAAMLFIADSGGFVSGRYGAAAPIPAVDVVMAGDKLSFPKGTSVGSLSFAGATGIFKGKLKVDFASGKATLKFAGVVIPGWYDCGGCSADASGAFSGGGDLPLAVGSAWFADVEGGASAKRGFSVLIERKEP